MHTILTMEAGFLGLGGGERTKQIKIFWNVAAMNEGPHVAQREAQVFKHRGFSRRSFVITINFDPAGWPTLSIVPHDSSSWGRSPKAARDFCITALTAGERQNSRGLSLSLSLIYLTVKKRPQPQRRAIANKATVFFCFFFSFSQSSRTAQEVEPARGPGDFQGCWDWTKNKHRLWLPTGE